MTMKAYEVTGIDESTGASVRRRIEAEGPEDAANRAASQGVRPKSVDVWTGGGAHPPISRPFRSAAPARPEQPEQPAQPEQPRERFRSIRCGCGQVVPVPLATWRVVLTWLVVLFTFPLGLLVLLAPLAEVNCPGCGGRVSAGLM